jgi:anti-sigma regulatory factor (Ser/Thr protein kinase)
MSRQMRISNDFDSLREMSAWVASSCKSLGISDALCFRLDLAANEAVTNTISYGYAAGGRGEIALRLSTEDDLAVLEIEDDGLLFNPLALAEPSPVQSLEASPIGGLGVLLIRRNVAHCDYQRRDGRNVLTLKSPISGN